MNSSLQNPISPWGAGSGKVHHSALDISIIIFMTIALYNAIELAVLILVCFRRYRSLYFWSLLTSAVFGVPPYTIGVVLQFFNLEPLWLSVVMQNIAWILMVPNQSVVLYSRLHLVSQSTAILGFVRVLIILSLLVIVLPTIVLNAGWTFIPSSPAWVNGYATMERIEVTWFMTQESYISGVYIWEAIRLIRIIPSDDKRRHRILYELLAINIMAIAMDLVVVILQYLNYYFLQVIFKGMVYSVKLKLEFAVLSMLVSVVHSQGSGRTFLGNNHMMSNIPNTGSTEGETIG
jgi:hypothetical protein